MMTEEEWALIKGMKRQQFERLPKYARQELLRLSRSVQYMHNQLKETSVEDTDTYVQNYTTGDRGLPKSSRVVFKSDDGEVAARVVHYADGSRIEISTAGLGARRMVVKPQASNVIIVGTDGF